MKKAQPLISAIALWNKDVPYPASEFAKTLKSVLNQFYPSTQMIVVDGDGKAAKKSYLPKGKQFKNKVKVVAGAFKNKAAYFNAGLKAAKGDYILLIDNLEKMTQFRQSAFDTFFMTAQRNPGAGMIFSDYERIAPDGVVSEARLLPYHEGRLRDAVDFGKAFFFSASVLKKLKGLKEKYDSAELYDLRLRASEQGELIGIANRFNGSLYSVKEKAGAFDVFYYLKAGKKNQLELEQACTEHLKRIGAYLAPGQNYHRVKYTPAEEKAFKCLFTVVIPVFNRPDFIATAIQSVQAQTLGKKVEVIVACNGGENDPTCDAVRSYMKGGKNYDPAKPNVDLIVTDINNIGLCLNLGLQKAKGKFYLQLDSDDQLTPDAAEKVLETFQSDPRIGMVIGSYEVWEKQAKTGKFFRREDIPVVTHDEWTEKNGRNNLLRINGAGAPRSAHIKVIRELGWFGCNDEPYSRNYGEDYDLVNRVIEVYRLGRVWDPIYKVVRHSGGTDHAIDQNTIDRNDNAKDNMRLKAISRRKAINAKSRKK
ncbi:glycosyltransferase [Candidatus Sumerlaeota bacterium]|nr:glycosyltransferase [Candidatus Sumerlaeota bacterium]